MNGGDQHRKNSVESTSSSISSNEANKKRVDGTDSGKDNLKVKVSDGGAKGGFLAPTRSWLSHMGEKLNMASRSPSPSSNKGSRPSSTVPRRPTDRSPSLRRRESSADSDAVPKPPPRTRRQKTTEKDPSLPSVKRTASMRVKTTAASGEVGAGTAASVKRSASLRKPVDTGSTSFKVRNMHNYTPISFNLNI